MRRTRRGERGYSLVEMLVVVAVSAVLLIMAYELIESAMRTSLFVESHNTLAQLAQRPVNFIQNEVYQNRIVFVQDTGGMGAGYLDRFLNPPAYPGSWPSCSSGACGGPAATLSTMPAIQANSLLPVLDSSNVMGPDAGTGTSRMTGNVLFLVRQLPPILIPYDHDNDPNTPDVNFPADRYRFELYYLSRNTSRPFSSQSYSVDLIQARSIDFADYYQLYPLLDGTNPQFNPGQISQIVNGLTTAKLRLAFDPTNQMVSNAFYSIANNGKMTARANQGIWLYQAKSLLPELRGGAISGKVNYTVGFRPSATTAFPTRDPIPKFAVYDSSLPAFPSGYEVKVVGAGNARKILVRLVLLANYGAGKFDSQEGFVITSG